MSKHKNILVLFSYRSHKLGYIEMLFDRLSKQAATHGLTLYRGALKEMHISITEGKLAVLESLTGKSLDSFDDVYYELWYKCPEQAFASAIFLKRRNKRFFSQELLNTMPLSKVGELAALADQGIPLPDTFTSSAREIKKVFAKRASRPFAYPFVMKAADGYGGKNNFLITSYQELKEVLTKYSSLTFVCQAFIPNDCDYRCIVLGDKVRFVLKRTRTHAATHLNNTSQGADGVSIPADSLPPYILDDAVRAAQILRRSEFSGVDVLIDKQTGKHYILEVNQTPQIEIGAEIDKKMDALLGYIKERTES